MPFVTILRGTIALGQHQDPGALVELSNEEAIRLVALGKAAPSDGADIKGAPLESLVPEAPAKKGPKK